jgi:hypothetical protein
LTLDSLLWNRGRGRLKGRRIAVKFSNNDGSAEGWFRATVESNHREDGVECLTVRYDVDHDGGDEASNTLRISKEGGMMCCGCSTAMGQVLRLCHKRSSMKLVWMFRPLQSLGCVGKERSAGRLGNAANRDTSQTVSSS